MEKSVNDIYRELGVLQGKYDAVYNQQTQLKADIEKRFDELKRDMATSNTKLEENIKEQHKKLEEDFQRHHKDMSKGNESRDAKIDEVLKELRQANLSDMKKAINEHQEAKHKFTGALRLWGMITSVLGLIAGFASSNFFGK